MTKDQENPPPRNILSGIFWVSAGRHGTFIINLACQLALVWILVPEDFGKFALMAATVDFILLFISAWHLSLALIQMKGVRHLESTVLFLSYASFGIVVIIALLGYMIVARFYTAETAALFCGLAVVKGLSLLSGVYGDLLRRDLKFKSFSLVQAAASVISVGIALIAATKGFGLWSLFIREAAMQGISYVGFRTLSRWPYGSKFDRDAAKRIFSFCGKIFVLHSLDAFLYRVDKILVGSIFGSKGLGFYERSQYFCNLATSSMTSLSVTVGFPAFANVQHDVRKLEKGLNLANFFFTRISLMLSVGIFIFPDEVVRLFLGEKWLSAAPALRWFAPYIFFMPLLANLQHLLYARGQITPVIRARVLQIISFVFLLYALTRVSGLEGAALAFAASTGIALLVLLWNTREEAFSPRLHILRPVLAALITVGVLMNSNGILQETSSLFRLSAAPVLFGVILISFEVKDLWDKTKVLLRM